MNIRMKVLSLFVAFGLIFAAWSPSYAATGKGRVVCDGDGVIVFGGDFAEGTLFTKAGVFLHTKPTTGSLKFIDGQGFVKQSATGEVTLYVGYGGVAAKNVRNIKVTLSGADAHFEIVGRGRLSARGDGACTYGNGQTLTWKPDSDVTLDVTQ